MEIRVFCYWCIRIGHLELTSHGPAETVYCSVSNKGVLRWESSFDLSGQSFRCHFGHNFSDGLVLLRDLRGRTGHRTWGRTWVWRPLAEWYTTRSKPSVLVPKVDSRLLDETIWNREANCMKCWEPTTTLRASRLILKQESALYNLSSIPKSPRRARRTWDGDGARAASPNPLPSSVRLVCWTFLKLDMEQNSLDEMTCTSSENFKFQMTKIFICLFHHYILIVYWNK